MLLAAAASPLGRVASPFSWGVRASGGLQAHGLAAASPALVGRGSLHLKRELASARRTWAPSSGLGTRLWSSSTAIRSAADPARVLAVTEPVDDVEEERPHRRKAPDHESYMVGAPGRPPAC